MGGGGAGLEGLKLVGVVYGVGEDILSEMQRCNISGS